jgi:hypothetical protein
MSIVLGVSRPLCLRFREGFEAGARKTEVFVNDTMLVEPLATRFGMGAWAFYHDALEGATVLEGFRWSSDGVLVCTPAEEHGLDDHSDIDHVLCAS